MLDRKYGNMGAVKTTIEIPDALLRRSKATAALRGESLKDFVNRAIEAELASRDAVAGHRDGWRSVFGSARRQDVAEIDRALGDEFEHVDPADWQ